MRSRWRRETGATAVRCRRSSRSRASPPRRARPDIQRPPVPIAECREANGANKLPSTAPASVFAVVPATGCAKPSLNLVVGEVVQAALGGRVLLSSGGVVLRRLLGLAAV